MKQVLGYLSFWIILFLCSYFLLYIFPFPFGLLPFEIGKAISGSIDQFWKWLVLLVANIGLGYPGSISTSVTGSGDTTYHFFKLLVQVVLAIIVSVIWLFLDRKKRFYTKLIPFFTVYLRYYLAVILLNYGLAKVFPNQFWEPGLTDLLKPFGDISPMGLLWKFMGYSVPYIIFTGVLEVLAGVLLFYRNTIKLGAVLTFGIMLNIFVLNMSYDVPVKLYSFHLLILAIILSAPYFKQLLHFFILNRPVAPSVLKPYFKKKTHQRIGHILKSVLILFVAAVMVSNNYKNQWTYGRKVDLPPLYGIYEVENFIINNDTIAPLLTHKIRWRRLVIDRFNANVTKMNGEILYAGKEIDTVNSSIKLTLFKEGPAYNFNYDQREDNLILTGNRNGATLKIDFKIRDKNDFYLKKRGFHWINEFPNNR